MIARERRVFTQEFKTEAVNPTRTRGKTPKENAGGVSPKRSGGESQAF